MAGQGRRREADLTLPGPLLQLTGVTKRYPGSLANDGVALRVERNQIHALLGENGAGKSTLVKIIYGVVRPDAGTMLWDGAPVTVTSPRHAQRLGIGMVFQHFSLFEALTVAENIALGLGSARERAGLRERIVAISTGYGLPLDPDRVVHDLSVGERQRIEIVRCLLQAPKLLIMDEPTSVLTPGEAQALFVTLRRLAAEGCSILYISHKLEEVRALCSAATILRRGRTVATCVPTEKTVRELAEIMIGTDLPAPRPNPAAALAPGARPPPAAAPRPRLVLDRLTVRSPHPFGTNLHDVTLSVAAGQILGIAGIAGNGQTELMDALSGEILAGQPESVLLDGVPAGHMTPQDRRRRHGCFVPEDRHGHGAVDALSLSENGLLTSLHQAALARFGVVDRRRTHAFAADVIRRFDVRTAGPRAAARSLSGGNLQKFLVGREIVQAPAILVLNQPTWGVDAGAALAIHEAIRALTDEGTAIVVISQDLDEIFTLADSVAVIAGGRVSAPVPIGQATVEAIGQMMGGAVPAYA